MQLNAKSKDDVDISPEFRKWFEIERREQSLKIENRRQSLRSAQRQRRTIVGN